MIFMTLMYIAYLNYADMHLTKGGKALEVLNESTFLAIQYNFVLLNGLIFEPKIRSVIGNVLIACISTLLAVNFIAISVVSIKP